MAILVTETGGNFSAATWYRAEAWQLDAATVTNALSTSRYAVTTFANAGNLRGAIFAVGGYQTAASPVGRYLVSGIQKGSTATLPVASPGIVTQTSHGFTGSRSGVTISNGDPALITYAGHGLKEGDRVGFTTSGGLPTGVTAGTIYYCRYIDVDTFNISATQKGALIATSSAGSGTHSMWVEYVQFTTTGALPTGVTANTVYCVKYINANTYNLSTTAGGTSVNFTGSTSGTHKAWHNKEFSFLTTDQVCGTGQTYFAATHFVVPMLYSGTVAVDTTASGWRFYLSQTDGSGSNYYVSSNVGVSPFFVAWCNTSVAWSDGSAPVICAATTYDTTTTFTGVDRLTPNGGTGVYSCAGIICTPAAGNRAYSSSGAGNVMLGWDGSATHTLTIDGGVWLGTHAGVYVGTEDAPISYANKAIVNLTAQPTYAGASANASGFYQFDFSSNYYGGGATFVFAGAYPAQRFATLVSDAATGQKDLIVDDASGFAANDYVYISKHDAIYSSGINSTRYQIASILSNTITLTANVSGENRLTGGRVVLCERGYGVQVYSTSLASYSNWLRGHGVSNVYIEGVYGRGVVNTTGYAPSYRFPDNLGNYRASGWYIGYSLCETYQNSQATTCSFATGSYGNAYGMTVEHLLVIMCTGIGTYHQWAYNLGSGVTRKCGPATVSNFFSMRAAATSPTSGGGLGLTGSTYTNMINHNGLYGVTLGQDHIIDGVDGYGCYNAMYQYSASFAELKNASFDRCQFGYAQNATGLSILNVTERDCSITNCASYIMAFTADTYYQWDIINPAHDIMNIDTTYQAGIAPGSEIRVVNNAGTTNNDLVISPDGYKQRCGSGLTDSTTYSANLYSWRLQPTNQPELESFSYKQIIGDQQNRDMIVYMWVKLNSANYWAGTNRLPRLTVDYDNGTEIYTAAAQVTTWQILSVLFQPVTAYPKITITFDGYTDAVGTNSYFYLGQIGVMLPAGRTVDPGALNYWADAKPMTGLATSISAADVWAMSPAAFGAGTIGDALHTGSTDAEIARKLVGNDLSKSGSTITVVDDDLSVYRQYTSTTAQRTRI